MEAARARQRMEEAGLTVPGDEGLGTPGLYDMRAELARVTDLERQGKF